MVVSPSFGQPWRPDREKNKWPEEPKFSAPALTETGVLGDPRRGEVEGKDVCREIG